MRLSIRHTTRYRFDAPVVHALQRLRLTPKETQGQRILEWEMQFEGAERELDYEDQNHNTVTLVAVEEGVQDVVIACTGQVDTKDYSGVIGRHAGYMPLWSFLGQTDLTRAGTGVAGLASELKREDGETLDMLHSLSALIRDRVEYRTGTTQVNTNAEDAIAGGAGVCQDHSHIFISAARSLNIPARYISGYLMMNDRVDQEATHAWAEAFVEGLGWVGFDISNGISPDERYVRVATGRDYADAAPVTGISFGSSSQELEVDVAVEQQQVEQ